MSPAMIVEIVKSLSEMNLLRFDWDAVAGVDPLTTVFLLWPWMRAWMEVAPDPVHVLAARPSKNSPFVAFWPITYRGADSRIRIDHVREIAMGGEPLADTTGFLLTPGYEQAALLAFADTLLHQLNWDRLNLKDVRDPRMNVLLPMLAEHEHDVHDDPGQCCPYVALPESWAEFEREQLSRAFRHSLRQKMKRSEKCCRLTTLADTEPHQQIEALISLALSRKRKEPDPHLYRQRAILDRCVSENLADIIVLRKNDEPIAGAAMLIDEKQSSMGCIVTGYDESHADESPGTVVMAHAIRRAIERGFKTFDFYRGDEAYKFRFGAQVRYNRNVRIARHGLGSTTRLTIDRLRHRLGA
ncbi:MAG TPA: GNAT family N-acetyltransferase [Phycisphaerales bacterium]|nr:GNAT family N-acetyltransferase [Phycisphaerales bacterium]